MRVLAVDPGGVTGIARYIDGEFDCLEAVQYDNVCAVLGEAVKDVDVLVCEGFAIRSNTHKLDAGAFNQTTDLIGACRLLALQSDIEFVRQTPADAKSFSTDDKLKRLGWYTPTSGGHANDATRHLLRYLAAKHYPPTLQALTEETP